MTSWFDDPNDTELLDLIPFFEALDKVDNVLSVLGQNNNFRSPSGDSPVGYTYPEEDSTHEDQTYHNNI